MGKKFNRANLMTYADTFGMFGHVSKARPAAKRPADKVYTEQEVEANRESLRKRLEEARVDELSHLPEVPDDVMAWIKSKASS